MARPTTYTAEEDALLARLVAEEVPIKVIVARLPGRTEQGVKSRLRTLRERGAAAYYPERALAPPVVHAPPLWTPEKDATLTRLWADHSLSTMAIASAMRITKNSVIGRAHRINLPSRPSPIRTAGGPRKEKAPTVAVRKETAARVTYLKSPPTERSVELARINSILADVRRTVAASPAWTTARSCQWPIGELRTPSFRFCGCENVVRARPYCAEHCASAYEGWRAPRVLPSEGRLA